MLFVSHNVQTLSHRSAGAADQLYEKGLLLRAQYAELGALCIGVQESRTPPSMKSSLGWYIIASGCADGGSAGCELWINTRAPYSGSACLNPRHLAVVRSQPRLLAVAVTAPGLSCTLVVAHAPH
eukprot:11172180-Lingulodinium_polyedra.AAC.1